MGMEGNCDKRAKTKKQEISFGIKSINPSGEFKQKSCQKWTSSHRCIDNWKKQTCTLLGRMPTWNQASKSNTSKLTVELRWETPNMSLRISKYCRPSQFVI